MRCERGIDQHDTSVGQRKNMSFRPDLNPWPPAHPASALSTEVREIMENKLLTTRDLPRGVWEVVGSIPLGGSRSCHVDQFTFHIILTYIQKL